MDLPSGPLAIVAKSLHRAIGLRRSLRGPLRPSWPHKFETFATFMRRYASVSIYLPLSRQRAMPGGILASGDIARTTEVEWVDVGDIQAAWFRRADSDPSRVLYYLHGGGYSICSIETHYDLLCRLCAASGATVFAINYRLAPEHPYPAQLEDSLAAYEWLLDQGVDPERLVIAGESAGGGLTMSTLLSLRDSGRPLPAAAAVISPWVDLEARGGSYRTNHRYDYISRRAIRVFAKRFTTRDRLRDPLAAPIHADLSGLPPLLVHVGGAEVLLDEGIQLARNARDAGVECELDIWQDMIHAWHVFAAFVPEGREAIDRVGQFVSRHTATAAAPARVTLVE